MLKLSKGQKYQILRKKKVENQTIKCQNFQTSKKNNKELDDSKPIINKYINIYVTTQHRNIGDKVQNKIYKTTLQIIIRET